MGIERRTPKAASGRHARMPSQTVRAIGELIGGALATRIGVDVQGACRLRGACVHQA